MNRGVLRKAYDVTKAVRAKRRARGTARVLLALLLAASGIGLLVPAPSAHACSCAPPGSAQEAMQRQSAVFSGKVTNIARPLYAGSSAAPVRVTIKVDDVWKGQIGSRTVVTTALSGASCGYEGFREGESYVVFASEHSGRLETGLCSLTQPLAAASDVLNELGEGYKPIGPLDDGRPPVWVIALAIAAIALAASGMFILARRARTRSGDKPK